jgi:hypothetical protein
VTEIFDESTQQTIKSIEHFFKQIVKDKMYWTRDILHFFGVKSEDISIFLNYHQVYKWTMSERHKSRSLATSESYLRVTDRHGSYAFGAFDDEELQLGADLVAGGGAGHQIHGNANTDGVIRSAKGAANPR